MIGIDIVKISRIKKLDTGAFLNKCFCPSETDYINGKKFPEQTMAGIFAAKEAAVKALGSGFVKNVVYTDIEIVHDENGAPMCLLHGPAERLLSDKGNLMYVSISHDGDFATAVAMIK